MEEFGGDFKSRHDHTCALSLDLRVEIKSLIDSDGILLFKQPRGQIKANSLQHNKLLPFCSGKLDKSLTFRHDFVTLRKNIFPRHAVVLCWVYSTAKYFAAHMLAL